MQLKNRTQISVQLDDELLEDVRIIAKRRRQSLSEFVRSALEVQVEIEAKTQVD